MSILSVFYFTAISLFVRIVHGTSERLGKYFLNEMMGQRRYLDSIISHLSHWHINRSAMLISVKR